MPAGGSEEGKGGFRLAERALLVFVATVVVAAVVVVVVVSAGDVSMVFSILLCDWSIDFGALVLH